MSGEVFDPGIFLAFIVAALWLAARPLIEWLILPGMRRDRRARATPYDWPVWAYRARLAAAAYLGLHGHHPADTRDTGHGHPRRPARPPHPRPGRHPAARAAQCAAHAGPPRDDGIVHLGDLTGRPRSVYAALPGEQW